MKMNKKEAYLKPLVLIAVTVMLVLITALSIKGTVYSMEKDDTDMERYYKELEKQYIRDVREALKEQGLENAGVMLTKIIYEDGSRNYTLTLNHGAFKGGASYEKREMALEAIGDIVLDIPVSRGLNVSFEV